ncbi:MAG: hypothetical protein CL492_06935 [Acinetobacter sp.]|uniref:Uncharacterized protein n=1 Tax=Acinetobacter venetianus (strain ATCC 31012 / DSM 23050 / BCRC 14357 / CCUG 45561 / CIP 110063 / KCTC 2702 / LMG 19082 / RAG-1) TaxID=1191460 RepID=N8YP74_ACIVR|nr:hypothetical protein F959_00314 [Acinetobacter venetianus RAG-1 = CIP 110063]MBC68619.1 hypothetical protein [Acinetobacter sp.]MBT49953.1 hypothetical protein [Acinetobacter sp.]HIQ33764.1 hypothetical protein [Acinetobacter venetianus]
MGNFVYLGFYLLALFISTFFAYLSYRKAMIKYEYKISIFAILLPTVLLNIFLIIIGTLRGESIFFYSLILLLNIIGPYLAIRKVSNYKNQM